MPRVESELRSRDLEQMLAELTITEEPVPIGTGSRLPRLAGQRDTLALTEVWDTRAQRAGYVALPTNELSNPLFGTSLAGWDTAVASEHTGEVEWDASQIDHPRRLTSSARIAISASTGAGSTVLSQTAPVTAGETVSLDVWARITEITGSPSVRLQGAFLQLDGTEISRTALVTLGSAGTDFARLAVEDELVPATAVSIQFEVQAYTDAASDELVAYIMNAQLASIDFLVPWTQGAIAGFHRAYVPPKWTGQSLFDHFTTTLASSTRSSIWGSAQ